MSAVVLSGLRDGMGVGWPGGVPGVFAGATFGEGAADACDVWAEASVTYSTEHHEVDLRNVLMLRRVEDEPEPDYCIHGQVQCVGCGKWCWLGHATYDAVVKDRAAPYCWQCGAAFVKPEMYVGRYVDTMGEHD